MVKGRMDAVTIFTPCADARLADLSRVALDAFNERALDRSLALWRQLLGAYPANCIATAFVNRIESLQEQCKPVSSSTIASGKLR